MCRAHKCRLPERFLRDGLTAQPPIRPERERPKVERGDGPYEVHNDHLLPVPQQNVKNHERGGSRGGADGNEGDSRKPSRSHWKTSPYSRALRRRSAFVITETELKVMAALAIMGLSSRPTTGYRTPRMVKIFMRRGCSTGVSRQGVLDSGCHVADRAQAELGRGRAARCSCLDGCVLRDNALGTG